MQPLLDGVPETMLWTLHNRASEAARPDGVIRDPKCLEIYRALDYDFERSFGRAGPSHGVRSKVFDDLVRGFIARNPDGPVIVNLGEGLETQRFRIADDPALWISVDMPDAIGIRERFIQPDERHLHVAKSALDFEWFSNVPDGRPVFVTAQGLLMYLEPSDVQRLVVAMANRWPGVEFAFDHIPPFFSRRTTSAKGMKLTKHYTAPRMPWGVRNCDVVETLRAWVGSVEDLGPVPFELPRGLLRHAAALFSKIPGLRNQVPGVSHVRLGSLS